MSIINRRGGAPGGTIRVRGSVDLTTFDPIKNTPGTPDRRARRINGTGRRTVLTSSEASRGGVTTYQARALPSRSSDTVNGIRVRVPSLPRRKYIPTIGRLELDEE